MSGCCDVRTYPVLNHAFFLMMNIFLMGGGFMFGWWSYDWSLNYEEVDETPAYEHWAYFVRCGYLVLFPYLFLSIMYQWFHTPFQKEPIQPVLPFPAHVNELDGSVSNRPKLFYRYVTRGVEPSLVLKNAEILFDVLTHSASLPFQIEIVSDNPIIVDDPERYRVLVVPESVVLTDDRNETTLYKARALHYANSISTANELTDWIVHLDEETRLIDRTVYEIERHCMQCPANAIGQGSIVYYPLDGQFMSTCHVLNTLADSIRVSDDFGKFRYQFESQACWNGMKGSFIVIQVWNEKRTGFNHGRAGSITEDCFFAMKAFDAGASFRFIHGTMFEKSPFTFVDFLKQRRRWLTGLRLVYSDSRIRFGTRIWLRLMVYLWMISSFSILLLISYWIEYRDKNVYIELLLGWTVSLYVLMYVNGFYITLTNTPSVFRPSRFKIFFLFFMQILLVPYFSLLEAAAVVFTVCRRETGFHVVQKK